MFAPGSESHTSVAAKYEAVTRARAELAEYRANEVQRDRGHSSLLPINVFMSLFLFVSARNSKTVVGAAGAGWPWGARLVLEPR